MNTPDPSSRNSLRKRLQNQRRAERLAAVPLGARVILPGTVVRHVGTDIVIRLDHGRRIRLRVDASGYVLSTRSSGSIEETILAESNAEIPEEVFTTPLYPFV